jgi:hypothetical protein
MHESIDRMNNYEKIIFLFRNKIKKLIFVIFDNKIRNSVYVTSETLDSLEVLYSKSNF